MKINQGLGSQNKILGEYFIMKSIITKSNLEKNLLKFVADGIITTSQSAEAAFIVKIVNNNTQAFAKFGTNFNCTDNTAFPDYVLSGQGSNLAMLLFDPSGSEVQIFGKGKGQGFLAAIIKENRGFIIYAFDDVHSRKPLIAGTTDEHMALIAFRLILRAAGQNESKIKTLQNYWLNVKKEIENEHQDTF